MDQNFVNLLMGRERGTMREAVAVVLLQLVRGELEEAKKKNSSERGGTD
jgi:hypothetical protein